MMFIMVMAFGMYSRWCVELWNIPEPQKIHSPSIWVLLHMGKEVPMAGALLSREKCYDSSCAKRRLY